MKKLACTLTLSLVSLQLFAAADTPDPAAPASPAPAPTATTAAEPVATTLELKRKSTFTLEEASRNPFWPIGWKPTPKGVSNTTEQVGPEISANSFAVTSITVDSTGRYAIINGKVMNEGQVFGLQMGNQTYQLTVKAIQDGQVILARRDQEIAVPLRRR